MNRMISIMSVVFWIIVHFNEGTTYSNHIPPSISRPKANNFVPNFESQTYTHHVVTDSVDASKFWRNFYKWFRNILRNLADETGKRTSGSFLQRRLPSTIAFPCQTFGQRSIRVPDSVHHLRPGDIDVIAALGDSMTAAVGANSLSFLDSAVDNRGLSFSIGGQGSFRSHLTLPNILKEFNPQLIGYSYRDSFSSDRDAQFNMAEIMATTNDMPYMASKLLRRMRLDRRVNMQSHWKLITIMIGGNDFCQDICNHQDTPRWINRAQEMTIIKTLRIIRDTIPRTFVNLVSEPLVNLILSMDRLALPLPCRIGRIAFCPCLEGFGYAQLRSLYIALEQNYHQVFDRIAHLAEFHHKDFTVVYQPFGTNATVFVNNQAADISIMARDCINFSQKGHAIAANALWNNMMQPEWRKTMGFNPLYQQFECPSAKNPFLKTYFNSHLEYPVRIW